MGDYTLGHFHFTLREETPEIVVEAIRALLDYDRFKAFDFTQMNHRFFLHDRKFLQGNSAYHNPPTYRDYESCNNDYGYGTGAELKGRFNFTCQIKYGHSEFVDFVDWITPYVEINSSNQGFVGYMISEYCDTIRTFIIDRKEDETL